MAVLRLQNTKFLGPILAKRLISTIGDPVEIFKERKHVLRSISGVGNRLVSSLFDSQSLRIAEKEMENLIKYKIRYRYFLDQDYPKLLQHCIDAPILLFEQGKIDLNNRRIISVVGTRNSSSYGRDFCKELIEDLAPFNPLIVSGFAYGSDICAHRAAMDTGLQTIAVLAHGLSQLYPNSHRKYVDQIKQNGGFLTEFPYLESPRREYFLRRNRIVAGISEATIVIESAEKGGSLVTADIANSYNREVFAVPGKASDIYSRGCNNLIRYHKANLLQSASDIIKMLNWDIPLKERQSKPIKKVQLSLDLDVDQNKIYKYLQEKGQQLLDQIALETQIPIHKMAGLLVQLELKGLVRPLPGKRFELT